MSFDRAAYAILKRPYDLVHCRALQDLLELCQIPMRTMVPWRACIQGQSAVKCGDILSFFAMNVGGRQGCHGHIPSQHLYCLGNKQEFLTSHFVASIVYTYDAVILVKLL